jgi:hypothetical protein
MVLNQAQGELYLYFYCSFNAFSRSDFILASDVMINELETVWWEAVVA